MPPAVATTMRLERMDMCFVVRLVEKHLQYRPGTPRESFQRRFEMFRFVSNVPRGTATGGNRVVGLAIDSVRLFQKPKVCCTDSFLASLRRVWAHLLGRSLLAQRQISCTIGRHVK
jgi:hypothetical protein